VRLHATKVMHDSTTSDDEYAAGGGINVYAESSSPSLVVDDHSSISDNQTGGITGYDFEGGSDVAIADSTIAGNTTDIEGAGGLYLFAEDGGGSVTLSNDTIQSNHATSSYSAGGVMVYDFEYAAVTLDVDGCDVVGNVASADDSTGGIGGYVYEYTSTVFNVTNSKVDANRATDAGFGGGVGLYADSSDTDTQLNLTGDVIDGNVSGSSLSGEEGYGGGVYLYDYAYLRLIDTTVDFNAAVGNSSEGGEGGGVWDSGYLGSTYQGSTITGNRATGLGSEGGGLWTYPYDGAARLLQSTVQSNTASIGAGVWVYEYQFEITQSTIADNVAGSAATAGIGGGLYDDGSVISVVNSTLTGNRAMSGGGHVGEGGAVYNDDEEVSLYFSTVSGNVAASGAAFYIGTDGDGTLRDSIVTLNHPSIASKAEADCHAATRGNRLTSLGGNVVASPGCLATRLPSDKVSVKPDLLALAANGGPTRTMALTGSSPALGAALGDCVATDQRGLPRPTKGVCDSGAYELVPATARAH
jgi:hypothetical protein